jgi:OFA family oxalate/formate antiporter-like MFS transporter
MGQKILSLSIADPEQLAIKGGLILAIASIFNGLGRLFWASVSDKIGRKNVFLVMFASQALLYCYIPQITSATVFTIAACYLLACYGGGFAVMPSFAADSFGPGYIGKVYGIILTAWGAAGVAGPLVFAQVKGAPALYVAAALLVLGFIITWSYKPPVKATA